MRNKKKKHTSQVKGPSIVSKSCVPIATNVLCLKGQKGKPYIKLLKELICLNSHTQTTKQGHILPADVLMKPILKINKAAISSFIKCYTPQDSTNNMLANFRFLHDKHICPQRQCEHINQQDIIYRACQLLGKFLIKKQLPLVLHAAQALILC